jgi:hypothetical protein
MIRALSIQGLTKLRRAPSFVRSLHKGWETSNAHLTVNIQLENALTGCGKRAKDERKARKTSLKG